MLRELLLALSGHSGDVFVQVKDCNLEVAHDLTWITASERDFLNRLCHLGGLYMKFHGIVEQQEDVPAASRGHYWCALCDGLRQLLADYLKDLVMLESEVLENPRIALTHIVRTVEPYQALFTALDNLFQDLESQKAHGCQVLDVLHHHSHHGDPACQAAIRSLQFHCHQVFFRQLSSWLLHGLLVDQHKEFFVQQLPAVPEGGGVGAGAETVDGANISTATLKVVKQSAVRLKKESQRQRRPRVIHSVSSDFLPSYLPVQLANKVLFIGEAVQMLALDEAGVQRSTLLYKSGSIFEDKEMLFARQLLSVQHRPFFSLVATEEVFMAIYSCISSRLWHVVMREANLVEHLKMFKNHFLLGRGELFSLFLDQAEQILRPPPNNNTEHDVNIAFQQAVGQLGSADDEGGFSFRATISLLEKSTSQDKVAAQTQTSAQTSGWQCLGLSCAVAWPLHLVFSDAALEDYNRLFRFLLSVKRASMFLHTSWINLMHGAQALKSMSADQRLLWKLRAEMAFFVDNLQYYLQVDVLTVQYKQLLDRIEAEQSFEAIRLAHDTFLAALTAQCFLNLKPASHCLKEIFRMANILHDLLLKLPAWSDADHHRLMDLHKMFSRQSGLLLKILSSVGNHRVNPHLAQLLLRSDFNYFYSKQSSSA